MKSLLLALALETAAAADERGPLGTWEGESICTVRNSPCNNEHVVYEIARGEKDKVLVGAHKIVSGEKQFMGTLTCDWTAARQSLHCVAPISRSNDWDFQIDEDGTRMTGTLLLDDRKLLYRRIDVRRK